MMSDRSDRSVDEFERFVLDQGEQPGGAAVVLLDDAAVAAGADPVSLVPSVLGELPEKLRQPTPFSYEAYVLQSVLGELLLGTVGEGWSDRELAAIPRLTVNYHDVAAEHAPAVDDRLHKLARLRDVFDGVGSESVPQVSVILFDGYQDAAGMVVPVCEQLGLPVLILPIAVEVDDERAGSLTDDALTSLARRHELGFHTLTHRMASEITPDSVASEVIDVVERLSRLAGRMPRVAAWCGGARFDGDLLGNQRLRELGVTSLISNWSWETISPARA